MSREDIRTVYISIGNSDDKLTQTQWAQFQNNLLSIMEGYIERTHGVWYSSPESTYQNMCCCVDISLNDILVFKKVLGEMARHYRQQSIAWAEVSETEFLCQRGI